MQRRENNFAGCVIENRYFMILVLVVSVMLRDRTSSYSFTLRTFMELTHAFEWTHGGFHGATQHTPHRTHTTTQDATQHNNTTTTPHGDRDRDRDRQRKDKIREERRFIFSVVVHGRFLLV